MGPVWWKGGELMGLLLPSVQLGLFPCSEANFPAASALMSF